MIPYQLHQIERANSAAEIRRADKQLGLMAEAVSRLWRRVAQPIAAMRAWSGTGEVASIPAMQPPRCSGPCPGREMNWHHRAHDRREDQRDYGTARQPG